MSASAAAWLCALPCAVVVLLAMLVLGPPLGRLVASGHSSYRFLHDYQEVVRPEPTEQGRFLVALTAPLLLSWATASVVRRGLRLPLRQQVLCVTVAQIALIVLIAASFASQLQTQYGPLYTRTPVSIGWAYLTPATLAVAAVLAVLSSLALGHAGLRGRLASLVRESSTRRVIAVGAAVTMTIVWLLHAINTDHSVANAPSSLIFHLGFTFDEAFAIVNGLTPLVDFSAQYGSLLPWVAALAMLVFGKTLLVFTITMCAITAVALLAIFDVLRRVTRNALTALLLYLPFLATSLYKVRGSLLDRDTFGTYFGAFPLRYAGPYLLAWLTARQLDKQQESRSWLLFPVAGLVLLNNLEFGIAAFGASIAALLWTQPIDRRSLLRLAIAVAAGLVAAFALVSLLTLWHAGSLPRLERLTDYAKLYAKGAFALLPIARPLGLHVVIYLTYVAAIAAATVRAVNREPNRVLTGMLVWSGVFGLGTASYFVGRSHPEALIITFSSWALALSLLAVIAVQQLSVVPAWRANLGTLLALFGFGVAICSLAQTPLPWSQISRLSAPLASDSESSSERPLMPERRPATRRFISSLADGPHHFVVKQGAPVAILSQMGHRTADAYGIVDVAPYTGVFSMETEERVEETLDALQTAGGNTVIVAKGTETTVYRVLDRRGFAVLTPSGRLARYGPNGVPHVQVAAWQDQYLTKWVDTHHLHPRALR